MKVPLTLFATLVALTGLIAEEAGPAPASSPQAENAAPSQTADKLWQEVEQNLRNRPNDKGEIIAYLGASKKTLADFIRQFPADPRSWQARVMNAQFDGVLIQLGQPATTDEKVTAELQEIVKSEEAPDQVRQMASLTLLGRMAANAPVEEFEKAAETYEKDYPDSPVPDQFKLQIARRVQQTHPEKAQKLLAEAAKSQNAAVAKQAEAAAKLAALLNKPLDIKFTALDGSEVDLAQMKGKVVLVDFWATWCGPCMQEVPNVVASYKKYQEQGFAIVGISLDQDKDAVLKVTKEEGMTWPQYFDGKGWKNDIAARYGISSIPQMWLVNKQGLLVSTSARKNLEEKIEKLLAE